MTADTPELELAPEKPGEPAMKQLAPFDSFRSELEKLKATALTLRVTEIDDKAGMKLARATRLTLKDLRVSIEHKRKELGEEALKTTQKINADAKAIKDVIEGLEEKMLALEEFAERETVRIEDEKRTARVAELTPFLSGPCAIDLGKLPDGEWTALITDMKTAHTERVAREEKAEADRVAKEKADADERERIRIENDRLKREAEERDAADKKALEKTEAEAKLTAERREFMEPLSKAPVLWMAQNLGAMTEPEFEKLFQSHKSLHETKVEEDEKKAAALEKERADAQAERDRLAKQVEDDRKAAQAKADAAAEVARKQREDDAAAAKKETDRLAGIAEAERQKAATAAKLAADEKEKSDAIIADIERVNKEAKAKADAEHAAELARIEAAAAAPDKEKLLDFAQNIREVQVPELATPKAAELRAQIAEQVEKFAAWIEKKAGAL